MESETRALLYGQDRLLLDTRVYLLRSAQIASVCASSLVDFALHLAEPSIGLAILCHTLSLHELLTALSLIGLYRGELGRIVLVSAFSPRLPELPDVFPLCSGRPEQLVKNARRFLGTTYPRGELLWLNTPAPLHGSTTLKAMGS